MTTQTSRYRLSVHPSGEVLAGALDCEARVFYKTYGNTAQDLDQEYGAYENTSVFLAISDTDEQVVGMCRVIMPSPAGLKTVEDIGRAPWHVDGLRAIRAGGADVSSTADVATIAVRPDLKVTPLASAALYHGLVMLTRANNIRFITMMLDERARRLLSIAGFVPRPIPGTGSAAYLGSPVTTPLLGNVASMIDAQRRNAPDAYRLITLGVGLNGIEVPAPGEYLARPLVGAPADARALAWTA